MTIELDLFSLPLIWCSGFSEMAEQSLLNGSVESFCSCELTCSQVSSTDTCSGFPRKENLASILLCWSLLRSTIFTQKVHIYFTLSACLPIYFYIAMGYHWYAELQVPEIVKSWHWYPWMIDTITVTLSLKLICLDSVEKVSHAGSVHNQWKGHFKDIRVLLPLCKVRSKVNFPSYSKVWHQGMPVTFTFVFQPCSSLYTGWEHTGNDPLW